MSTTSFEETQSGRFAEGPDDSLEAEESPPRAEIGAKVDRSGPHKGAARAGVKGNRIPSRRARLTLAVAAVCLSSGLGFVSFMPATPEDLATAEATPLSVEVVEIVVTDQFEQAVSFLGRVEAARESELSFERVGLITEVHVDEGDTVQAMQPLATLDIDKLQAQRDVFTARLEAARATLDELVAGPRQETIDAQRAEVSRLASELKRAELQRDRQAQLLPRAATSKDEYESALYAAQAARSALDAAERLLQELENGTRNEQVMNQRAVVKQIEAERHSIDVDIRKSQLLAPFAGTVAERFVDEGRVVAAGQSIIRLLEMSRPEIRVGVDSETAAGLSVGERLPALIHGQTFDGEIKAIRRDVADKTRTVDVLLSLDQSDMSLERDVRSGELVTVLVNRLTQREGAWIPIGSLTQGSRGLWSIFVVTEEAGVKTTKQRIERRDVEVLHSTADRVFVRGALDDGDQIVTSGIHRLVPGQAVRPINRTSPGAGRSGEQDR